MLVVHWSPVKNTRRILRTGTHKGRAGVFCFPLTGFFALDHWWADCLYAAGVRTHFNGFVFRLVAADLPALYGDCVHRIHPDRHGPPRCYETLRALETAIREDIAGRIATDSTISTPNEAEIEKLTRELLRSPARICAFQRDAGQMEYLLGHHEIVLSRSITPDRIIRVVSGSARSGRARVRLARARRHETRAMNGEQ
jgi:hypothetical protein